MCIRLLFLVSKMRLNSPPSICKSYNFCGGYNTGFPLTEEEKRFGREGKIGISGEEMEILGREERQREGRKRKRNEE
jgi:hypothetical protein